MESQQFDRVARMAAAVADRRVVVRALAAGALAEAGLVGWADRVEARNEDAGIRYYERLAAELKRAGGDCDAVAAAAERFRQAHAAALDQLRARERQWGARKRSQVATRYQRRITRATESLHTALAACRYRGEPESAICRAPGGVAAAQADDAQPGAVQCGAGCDCGCICPISTGDCAWSFFGCLGGSEASCCWFGACAGHQCDEQCPNCCTCNNSCCGC